jgi:hypothetical protein
MRRVLAEHGTNAALVSTSDSQERTKAMKILKIQAAPVVNPWDDKT